LGKSGVNGGRKGLRGTHRVKWKGYICKPGNGERREKGEKGDAGEDQDDPDHDPSPWDC